MKKNAVLKGINDAKVHQMRKMNIIENLKAFKLSSAMTERDLKKLVGKNKVRKNKEEEIKLSTLKQAVSDTISGKKEEEEIRRSIFFI